MLDHFLELRILKELVCKSARDSRQAIGRRIRLADRNWPARLCSIGAKCRRNKRPALALGLHSQ